jgi:hypothetical protein
MSVALICAQCGRSMIAGGQINPATGGETIWTCTGCGARLIQDVPPASPEQIRTRLHAAIDTGFAQGRSMFAAIRCAMTFIASGTLGILTWLLSQSAVAACIVAGSVFVLLFVLGLIQRLYVAPRRMNRMVEEMLKQNSWDSHRS